MATLEPITGRYVYLNVAGTEYRVYFEESGSGIPLVCQHTAGSDNRQWRHLMNDKDVTQRFRVIAPDLPFHGKSLPPAGEQWWAREYRLTKQFLFDFHRAFCKALNLDGPAYMGCSVGGHLAPDLALECPDLYRAVIGVQSGLGFPKELSAAIRYHVDQLHHPRISNDYKAAAMLGFCGPDSPEPSVRETGWIYASNAPVVFRGDLHYYFYDHTITAEEASRIDTSRVAVYFLTGEYDPGTSPAETQLLADQIKGAKFSVMPGLGHFGMCENYNSFRRYLLPVLDDLVRNRKA